ncbi:hypothetical protein SHT23_001724 [Escherichia coli]|nr:hypothetical protein [Escherichia coli]EEV3560692.1 hypothetical protein [Escherichia coli]EFK7757226.1 hypothetical protein [Escherichia coli]EFL9235567.1 hypothetical protein [Escherichia coli]EKC9705481.1 hypothetical protein [Escherichia coli]
MQEEKQHYLYVLVPENGDTFKIGISCGPLARFKGLQVSPDFALSRVYRGTRLAIVNLERLYTQPFSPGMRRGRKAPVAGILNGLHESVLIRFWLISNI